MSTNNKKESIKLQINDVFKTPESFDEIINYINSMPDGSSSYGMVVLMMAQNYINNYINDNYILTSKY